MENLMPIAMEGWCQREEVDFDNLFQKMLSFKSKDSSFNGGLVNNIDSLKL